VIKSGRQFTSASLSDFFPIPFPVPVVTFAKAGLCAGCCLSAIHSVYLLVG